MSQSGQYIRLIRESRNWSQAQLGKRLGVNRQAVSNWEVGRRHPSITALARLVQLAHVTPEYIRRYLLCLADEIDPVEDDDGE